MANEGKYVWILCQNHHINMTKYINYNKFMVISVWLPESSNPMGREIFPNGYLSTRKTHPGESFPHLVTWSVVSRRKATGAWPKCLTWKDEARVVESSRSRSDVSTNGLGVRWFWGPGAYRIPIFGSRDSERASVITEGRLGRVIIIYTNLCTKLLLSVMVVVISLKLKIKTLSYETSGA